MEDIFSDITFDGLSEVAMHLVNDLKYEGNHIVLILLDSGYRYLSSIFFDLLFYEDDLAAKNNIS